MRIIQITRSISSVFTACFLMSCAPQPPTEKTLSMIEPASAASVNADAAPEAVNRIKTSMTINEDICAAARNKNPIAQYKVAQFYDSMLSADAPLKNAETVITNNQKAKAAAMYWYDVAIHYDRANTHNTQARERRRLLGGIADESTRNLYVRFSQYSGQAPCSDAEVFNGLWY